MANIVITSTANYIKVDFGDYYPTYIPTNIAYYNPSLIRKVSLYDNMVMINMIYGNRDWELTFDGGAGFQVDSIDGVAPTSNSDLCDKIGALIKA